jgi:2,3-bisphosphoglycerate-independent phosphoglycerate mutase
MAATPHYDEICENYPQTLLEASGTRVGLPAGVMGNSEVGHLNIGAGRVIRMDVSRVDHDIATGEFFRNKVLLSAIDGVKKRGAALHLMGLISDGQVHSSQEHLYALLRLAKQRGLERVFVHCFLDGRDTPPSSAAHYVEALQKKIEEIGCGQIASLIGRYYAMDRDKRWERTERAYELLLKGKGEPATDPVAAILSFYDRGITDEFIEPTVIVKATGEPVAIIQEGDAVVFFNFRPDRARQLTRALAIPGFAEFDVSGHPQIELVCFTVYDRSFSLPVAFPPHDHKNVLVEVWEKICVHNYRLAETEKYAHVTYFFNGGVEKEHACERAGDVGFQGY